LRYLLVPIAEALVKSKKRRNKDHRREVQQLILFGSLSFLPTTRSAAPSEILRLTLLVPDDIRASNMNSSFATSARPWVLATTILASGMVFIDGTVVNVALPALQKEFNATIAEAQWVVESYALLLTALLLVGGTAGDQFGRRRVFVIGVALFAMASILCAMSFTVWQLIIARALQGMGGALLVPGSLSLISASFPEIVRGKAIGIWSGYTSITAALGPVLGGLLIEYGSWRYAFLINVPIAVLVIVLAFRYVPESRNTQSTRRLDWPGALLITIGLGCLVYALITSSFAGWSNPIIITALAVALVTLAGFVVAELKHPAPMLPLRLFRSRNFAGANLLTLLLYAALGGSLFFVPLNLIQVQGYSATAAGAAMLPFILTMFLLSRWSGGLVDRYGAKRPLIIGPTIAAFGFSLFAAPGTTGSYWTSFFPAILVLGIGMAVSVAPLTTTVMNAVEANLAGAASGTNNAVSRAAALLSIAAFGIVMSNSFSDKLEHDTKKLNVSPAVLNQVIAQREKLAEIALPPEATENDKAVIREIISRSFVYGFRNIMLISALLALSSALAAWLMIDIRIGKATGRDTCSGN
jgi:EmrB/QacA subfamily drug resistance transporter